MRIAIFSEVYAPMISGVSLTLKRTAEMLRARGHRVRIYSPTYIPTRGEAADLDLHASPSTSFVLSPQVQWAWPDQRQINRDLATFRPDLVHLATEFAMGRAGLHAARRIGVPVIASAHTDYERYAGQYGLAWILPLGWAYLRQFYGHAYRVLVPSDIFATHLKKRGISHTGLWTRGVDTDAFTPAARSAAYRASLGLGADDALVAYVGRLAPEKGIPRLLESWQVLSRLHPRAHLVFTGEGQMADNIRACGLPRVHMTGTLTGTTLAAAYASADVFAMPSETETFGNVTLEAMASGVAPLVVGAGGVLDFARHRDNAWLAPPSSPTEWVSGFDQLLANRPLRLRLAVGARRTALGRGWGPVLDALLAQYGEAAGGITSQPGAKAA